MISNHAFVESLTRPGCQLCVFQKDDMIHRPKWAVPPPTVPPWVHLAEVPPPADEEPYQFGQKDSWTADASTGMPWTGLLIAAAAFVLGLVVGRTL